MALSWTTFRLRNSGIGKMREIGLVTKSFLRFMMLYFSQMFQPYRISLGTAR